MRPLRLENQLLHQDQGRARSTRAATWMVEATRARLLRGPS